MKFKIPWPDDVVVLYELAAAGRLKATFEVLGLQVLGILSRSLHPDKPYSLAELQHDCTPADAPEFFPMLLNQSTGERIGYWLDDPATAPQYVAVQCHEPGHYWCCARNLFEALRLLTEVKAEELVGAPSMVVETHAALEGIRKFIIVYATESRYETGGAYLELYQNKAAAVRARLATAYTTDGIGIVVPATIYLPDTYDTAGLPFLNALSKAHAAYDAGLYGNALRILKDLRNKEADEKSELRITELMIATYEKLHRKLLAERLRQVHPAS